MRSHTYASSFPIHDTHEGLAPTTPHCMRRGTRNPHRAYFHPRDCALHTTAVWLLKPKAAASSLSHAHTLSLSLARTHTYTHTHTHTHIHIHTHTPSAALATLRTLSLPSSTASGPSLTLRFLPLFCTTGGGTTATGSGFYTTPQKSSKVKCALRRRFTR